MYPTPCPKSTQCLPAPSRNLRPAAPAPSMPPLPPPAVLPKLERSSSSCRSSSDLPRDFLDSKGLALPDLHCAQSRRLHRRSTWLCSGEAQEQQSCRSSLHHYSIFSA